jgi:hypothetical protein
METASINTVVGFADLIKGLYDIILPLLVSVAGITVAIRVFKKFARAN